MSNLRWLEDKVCTCDIMNNYYCGHGEVIKRLEAEIEQLVSSRTKALREALADCMPLMEFYLEREIGHPANHQEFAREKRELRDRLRAILKDGQP